jgi:hypothetical protein
MRGWDAVAASVGGVAPGAYGMQGDRMFGPALKPIEYTDDTLITVPVLESTALYSQRVSEEINRPREKDKSLSGFFRRTSSSFSSARPGRRVNITIRRVPNLEYRKHYLKDDHGRYMGTEEPAEDCILNEEDSMRWRSVARPSVFLEVPRDARDGGGLQRADGANAASLAGEKGLVGEKTTKCGLFKDSPGRNERDGIIY